MNNDNDNKFIKIPQSWLRHSGDNINLLNIYGDIAFGFYVYCLNHQLRFEDNNASVVSLSHFLHMFGFSSKSTKARKKKELISAIKHMQKDGLITFYTNFIFADAVVIDDTVNTNTLQYCTVNTDICENFTMLYKHEVVRILKVDNPLPLLIHFSVLMSHVNNKTQLAFPSLEVVAMLTNTSDNTCIKYNKVLQELELLYYDCAGMTWYGGTDYKSYNNTYARLKDKELVDTYIEEKRQADKKNITNTTIEMQELANNSRSLKARINHLGSKDNITSDEQDKLDELVAEYDDLRDEIESMNNDKYFRNVDKEDIRDTPTVPPEPQRINFEDLESFGYDTGEVILLEKENISNNIIPMSEKLKSIDFREFEKLFGA